MGKKDTPDAPDYTAAAEAQGESSRQVTDQQTWANRPNQVTPWGNVSWSATPTTDPATGNSVSQWTQNMELSPYSQEALSGQQRLQAGRTNLAGGLLERAESEFSQPMDWDALPEAGGTPDTSNFSTINTNGMQSVNPASRYQDEAANAVYNQFQRRMEPRFADDEAALQTKITNMGFQQGDEGYDKALRELRTGQNDMRLNAMDQATLRGGQEASRYHGMDLSTRAQQFDERGEVAEFNNRSGDQRFRQDMAQSSYANTIRQQALTEQMQRRGMSLNEINAILHGQQVGMPGMPDFMGANRGDSTQYLGAAGMQYNAGLDAFNAEQAALQGLLEGASSFLPW